MWIDEAEFFSRMESAASKLRRAPSQKNVNGRLADGMGRVSWRKLRASDL
jgi:hypothetical protein